MDAKAYAARNREGSDWFTHRSEPKAQNNVVVEPITDAPPSSSCKAQMIKPVCNSNQWFKHGEKDEVAAKHPDGDSKPGKTENSTSVSSACATWCIGGGEAKCPEAEPKTMNATQEGEANCIRDKATSDWFSHDSSDAAKNHSTPSHRMGSAEGNQNASRMRGESENWFSHDPNAPPQPLHTSKGRPSSRVQNSDMYNVFHHDQ